MDLDRRVTQMIPLELGLRASARDRAGPPGQAASLGKLDQGSDLLSTDVLRIRGVVLRPLKDNRDTPFPIGAVRERCLAKGVAR